MADTSKSRISRSGVSKSTARPAVSRRAEIRRTIRKRDRRWRDVFMRPEFSSAAPLALAFVVVAAVLTAWTREQILVAPGRIMTETRVVRAEFKLEDLSAVETRRRTARQNTPRVYTAVPSVFDEIENALVRLPTALADAETLDDVAPEIRQTFQLTEAELAALRTHAVAGDASQAWRSRIEALIRQLYETPLLDNETFQIEQTSGSRQWIELRGLDRGPARVLKGRAVNIASAQLVTTLRQVVQQAGFEAPLASMLAGHLARTARPTFVFDESATTAAQEAAAAAVPMEHITHQAGEVIYRRGERLSPESHRLLVAEREAYPSEAGAAALWTPRVAAFGLAALITVGLALFIAAFCPRIRRNPLRVLAVALLLAGALTLACAMAIQNPSLIVVAAAAPTVFVAAILVVAYDRPTALAIGGLHAALVTAALGQPASMILPALAGVVAVAWGLDQVRHRNDLIRTGVVAGLAMALAVAAQALLSRPAVPGLMREVVVDSSWTLGAGVAVGVLTLAILPTIERVFDIITGMTLIELRDPKNPLLRELQQRAPGTYNHSIAVANIAETAADAIGANSLHLYVGALYHDIGKMNKPDYFIENQSGGFNRHSKLSPAMSLLVIVGHVKDGVELAREYNLPRSLHHYIESHHGTTLVEYFYHQAQKQAEESKGSGPDEIEYRYPGPKPRSKEAAILMLSDAVESATRAMKEPAPSRIETLVHELASKRLRDGQFDECDLTLRELHTIEASIVKSVTSIYHARIAYSGSPQKDEGKRQTPASATMDRSEGARPAGEGDSMEKTMSQSA